MIIKSKIIIMTLLFLGYILPLPGQHWEGNYIETTPYEMLIGAYREGLNIQLEIDSSAQQIGIKSNQLMDQIKLAIDYTGWKLEPTSSNFLNVNILTIKETENNHKLIKIEMEHFLNEFSIQRTIDIPIGDNSLLNSTLYQLVHNFCVKAKMELLNERTRKIRRMPTPRDQLNSKHSWWDAIMLIEN